MGNTQRRNRQSYRISQPEAQQCCSIQRRWCGASRGSSEGFAGAAIAVEAYKLSLTFKSSGVWATAEAGKTLARRAASAVEAKQDLASMNVGAATAAEADGRELGHKGADEATAAQAGGCRAREGASQVQSGEASGQSMGDSSAPCHGPPHDSGQGPQLMVDSSASGHGLQAYECQRRFGPWATIDV